MAHFLTDAQFAALTALCDTLLPTLAAPPNAAPAVAEYYALSAPQADIPTEVTRAIRDQANPEAQAQIKQLLTLLSTPAGTALLTGHFRRFADLPFATRERVLQGWAVSPLGLLRQGFQAIKRLSASLYFTRTDDQFHNPVWPALGYPGPEAKNPARPKTIHPRPITEDTTLDCDVVIIGSGAGGGVVAGELAAAGHKVIVLEKGGDYSASDYPRTEYHAFRQMYERAGLLATEDLNITVLAGSTLGGGTTVNWAGAFHTPPGVLREWATQYGLRGFDGPEFQAALDAVARATHVTKDESTCNPQNQHLHDGSRALGYHIDSVPRNARGCHDCGWCQFGCVHDAKQGTLVTYLQQAHDHGAQIITHAYADRVLIERGQAVGVAATVTSPTADPIKLTVRARFVVLAAGAIHTPAILLRTGVANPLIGKHFWLHPTTAVHGLFAEPVESWHGVNMAVYSDEFTDLDGDGYGVKLETPPAHPGLMGFALPWQSARDFRDLMATAAHRATVLVLTRDKRSAGRVTIDKLGRPRLHYRIAKHDAEHMLTGIEAALRILAAAGATEVGALQAGLPPHRLSDAAALAAYIAQVWRIGVVTNRTTVMSAHQMGGARMSHTRSTSVVSPNGESWDVSNLFVADASTFPTPSGANPMLTIQGIAYWVAQHLKQRL